MSALRPSPNINLCDIAFDIQFNAAVLTICKRVLPAGYDVANDAPGTYEELVAHLDAGRSMLVYSGGAGRTIYGNPEVNYAFRAWHDWCHWRGRYDFSLSGERATCAMQGAHLVAVFGDSSQTRWWRRILHAEVIGQREYFDQYAVFPDDQRPFVEAFLRTAAQAAD